MQTLESIDVKAMRRKAEEAVSLLRALSNEARLVVLCELVGRERSAGELVACSGLSQLALSQHLAKLREEGLVTTRRDGVNVYYRLTHPKAARLLATLQEIYCRK